MLNYIEHSLINLFDVGILASNTSAFNQEISFPDKEKNESSC